MMLIVVRKIGTGTEDDPFRPDIGNDVAWQIMEERGNEFVIEVRGER